MKRCPVCKTKLNGNFSSCPVCGTKLSSYGFKEGPHGQFYIKPLKDSEIEELAQVYARKHSKKKKALLIAAACLCGAAVVSGTTYGITKAVIASSEANQKEYNVKFVGADGEILQNEKLKKGQDIIYKGSNPKKDVGDGKNYMCTGWDPVFTDGEKVVGDVTYQAQFKQIDMSEYLSAKKTGDTSCSVYWNKGFGQELKYLSIPSHIEIDGVRCVVEKIQNGESSDGTAAFENCESLLSVEIPSSVSYIEPSAFKGCTNLKKVKFDALLDTIPESCFEYCESLSDINIPSTVTTIETKAFANCDSLATLTLPAKVDLIQPQAFAVSSKGLGLKTLTIEGTDETKEYWNISGGSEGQFVPSDPVDNANKVKYDKAYYSFERIHNPYSTTEFDFTLINDGTEWEVSHVSGIFLDEDVVIPSTYKDESGNSYPVTTIGSGGFLANQIRSVKLPDTITTINPNAFNGCTRLTSINLENVTTIGANAFYNCKKLEKINTTEGSYKLNDKMTKIPEGAFYNSGIQSISLPSNCKIIGKSAFDSCYNLSEVAFNSALTEIGTYAFAGTAIKSASIPGTVLSIGTSAFMDCSQLNHVAMNTGTRSIGQKAFAYTPNLTRVTIPSTVDTLYNASFYGSGLTRVTFEGASGTITYNTFDIYNKLPNRVEFDATLSDLEVIQDYFTSGTNASNCVMFLPVFALETEDEGLVYSSDKNLVIDTKNSINAVCLNDDNTSVSASYDLVIPSVYLKGRGTDTNPYQLVEINEIKCLDDGVPVDVPTSVRRYLNSIEFSPTIKTVGAYAFYNCVNLSEISFTSNIKYLSKFALGHSYVVEENEDVKLRYIEIPSTLTYIEPYGNFCGYYNDDSFDYENLEGVIIDDYDTKWVDLKTSGSEKFNFVGDARVDLETLKTKAGNENNIALVSANFEDEEDSNVYYNYYTGQCYSDSRYLYRGDTVTYEIDLEWFLNSKSLDSWSTLYFYNNYYDRMPDVYDAIYQQNIALFTNVSFEYYNGKTTVTTSLTSQFNNKENWNYDYNPDSFYSYSSNLVTTIKGLITDPEKYFNGILTITMKNTHPSKDFSKFFFYTDID